VVYTHN
jgi:hypothetical protein